MTTPVKEGQSIATKPASLTLAEATARLRGTHGSSGAAAPAEDAGNAQHSQPTQDTQPEGLEPDVTHPEAGELDAGGSVDEVDLEDQDDGTDKDDDAKDPLIALMIDGEEVEVPLSELAEMVRKGTDYTNKTKALAESRRAVEQKAKDLEAQSAQLAAELMETQQQRQKYAETNHRLLGEFSEVDAEWARVDWNKLREEDPLEASSQFINYQLHLAKRQDALDERQKIADEARETARRLDAEEFKKLKVDVAERLPQWTDEKVRVADWSAMNKTAKAHGFTEAEVNATRDARILHLLHTAMLKHRADATRQSATSPAPNRVSGRDGKALAPAKVVTPGARPVIRAGNQGSSVNLRAAMENLKHATKHKSGNQLLAAEQYLIARRQQMQRAQRR